MLRLRPVLLAFVLCSLTVHALALPAIAADQDTIRLVGGGDVAYPPKSWLDGAYPKIRGRIWSQIKPLFAGADLVFCNLETPVTNRGGAVQKEYVLRMGPDKLGDILAAGFNLLSLANNHSADAGPEGLADTLDNLIKFKEKYPTLVYAGAGRTVEEAYKPVYFTPEGKALRMAFIAVGNNRSKLVASYWDPRVVRLIKSARSQADVVIVSSHGGAEYLHAPPADIVKRYRQFVDAGATLVLGHHPHVPQGVERRGKGVIFYSLGNLSFGSLTARHRKTGARLYALLADVTIGRDGVKEARAVPLWVGQGEALVAGGERLPPRLLEPQLLKGKFFESGLAALREWTAAIPGNATRVGDDGRILLK